MLTRMSATPDRSTPSDPPAESSGVLAGLPRTRPQRPSARRIASRAARAKATSPQTPRSPRAPRTARAPRATPASRRASDSSGPAAKLRPARERAPRQGYEAEPDALGGPVQPPGGAELIASAAELAGELAKTGVNAGARALKDLLSRLPG
jgi:hypothetical protein